MNRLAGIAALAMLAIACSDSAADKGSGDTIPPSSTAMPATTATPTTVPAVSTTVVLPAEPRPATIDELLALGRPIVLAHTAGEDEYPASTLFGFGESVKAGVDMLDMNVLLTGDGVLVVQHDDDVDRTTNGSGAVADLAADEIAALDNAFWFTPECGACTDQPAAAYIYRGIRTGDRPAPDGYGPDDFAIPTFRQVVERFPDLPLNVEIKGEGEPALAAARVLANELVALGREEATVVSSFDDAIVAAFHALLPDVEISPGLGASSAWVLSGTPLPDGMRILQLPPEFQGTAVLTPQVMADSTKAGYPIWVWPNDRAQENEAAYADFLDRGITGLNINFPAQGVRAVEEFARLAEVEPMASSGCSITTASFTADATLDFSGAGEEGTYIRHLPPAYDGFTPLPLVIDLHGWSTPAAVQVALTGLSVFGDAHRFVTITPDVTRVVPRWNLALDGADMKWMTALLDETESTLCIDTNRVFVTGMSNGAMMTSAIACVLSERVAAVAPVAGLRDPGRCAPDRPVPLIAFHGTDDQFLAFSGGVGPAAKGLASPDGNGTLGPDAGTLLDGARSVTEMTAAWAARNGCEGGEPTEESVADDVTLLRWDCGVGVETVLYRIEGGGHTWPGSPVSAAAAPLIGPTTTSISANTLMWQFFRRHPLGV